MKKTINYNELWVLEQDMQGIINESPAMALLLNEKINRFYNFNRLRLDTFQKTMKKLQKKYIVHDANDRPVREPVEGEEGKTEWKFLPLHKDENGLVTIGVDNKTEYYKEADKFLQTSFEIEL